MGSNVVRSVYPMFLEPVLRRFDFWAKIDVDVCFRRHVSVADVVAPLVNQRAIFFHAKLFVDNPVCEMTLGDFMQLYSALHGQACTPTSRKPPWRAWGESYEHPPVSFGNFIGGWLGFWQSPRVMHFARLWWEWEGGWARRWSDQQFWMPAMWMMERNDSASIVDLSRLRTSMFRHSKDFYACGGKPDKEPPLCASFRGNATS